MIPRRSGRVTFFSVLFRRLNVICAGALITFVISALFLYHRAEEASITIHAVVSKDAFPNAAECNLTDIALKAVSRARTEQCRRELQMHACKLQNGTLHPVELRSLCPSVSGAASNLVRYVRVGEADTHPPQLRVLFFLLLNGRSIRQVRRLLRLLWRADHYYFLHVDRRQDYLYRELLPLEGKFTNVRLMRNRFSTIWGGSSLLNMTLHAMQEVLNMSHWHWDYIINFSESDMPLLSIDELVALLQRYRGLNFLKSHGTRLERFIRKQGLDKVFYECDTHLWRIGDRILPRGVQLDGGSDWYVLHVDFVRYAVTETDALVSGFKALFRYALLPVESFFHTLLHNSPFCGTYVNANLKLTNWKRSEGCKCQYRHVVDWCGCSPKVFQLADTSKFRRSTLQQKLLYTARKFEALISMSIINAVELIFLESQLGDGAAIGSVSMPGWNAYWQNDYHVLDQSPPTAPVKLTVIQWLGLLAFEHMMASFGSSNYAQCSCTSDSVTVVELTLYAVDDVLSGYLVKFEVLCGGERVQFESWVERVSLFVLGSTLPSGNFLRSLEMGTLFDPKELIFRNYLTAIGPRDQLGLRVQWNDLELIDATVVFQRPDGIKVPGVYRMSFNTAEVGYMVPDLGAAPLMPGAWMVELFVNGVSSGHTKFSVFPADFDDFRMSSLDTKVPQGNLNVSHAEYVAFMHDLISQFYRIRDWCLDNMRGVKACLNVEGMSPCSIAHWSSLSPDPKSSF